MKSNQKKFGYAALALVLGSLLGLFPIISNEGGPLSADAQQNAGYSTRVFRQVPADGMTSVSGTEALGYQYLFNGATWDRERVVKVVKSVSLGAGTTETTIWTPASGKKF